MTGNILSDIGKINKVLSEFKYPDEVWLVYSLDGSYENYRRTLFCGIDIIPASVTYYGESHQWGHFNSIPYGTTRPRFYTDTDIWNIIGIYLTKEEALECISMNYKIRRDRIESYFQRITELITLRLVEPSIDIRGINEPGLKWFSSPQLKPFLIRISRSDAVHYYGKGGRVMKIFVGSIGYIFDHWLYEVYEDAADSWNKVIYDKLDRVRYLREMSLDRLELRMRNDLGID